MKLRSIDYDLQDNYDEDDKKEIYELRLTFMDATSEDLISMINLTSMYIFINSKENENGQADQKS